MNSDVAAIDLPMAADPGVSYQIRNNNIFKIFQRLLATMSRFLRDRLRLYAPQQGYPIFRR